MNPIVISNDITDTYFRYILTRFPFGKTNPDLRGKFKNLLYSADGKKRLLKGPILEIMPPYKKGNTLKDLSDQYPMWKPLVDHFIKNKSYNVNQSLYLHQEKALIQSINNNLIIASGTGSGKTECFLFPIIQYCLKYPGLGVRAILVYPLNALVEDQIQRLGRYLSDTQITFGKYTGQTPQSFENEYKICPNHLTNREEMRSSPPNILITNYAMLEYILLRPGDSPIIDSGDEHSFKFIILDEAHTYTGAQGTEVAYLLKRLRYRVKRKAEEIRYFATSATLGSEKDALAKTTVFASRLFSAPFNNDSLIIGEKEKISNYLPTKVTDNYNIRDILGWELPSEKTELKEIRHKFSINENADLHNGIYNVLRENIYLRKIISFLEKGPTPLDQLAAEIFPNISMGEAIQAVVNIVAWSDYAKNNEGISLLPARYHMFVSATKGLFCELSAADDHELWKSLYLSQNDIVKKEGKPYPFEIGVCKICGEIYIMGVFVKDDRGLRYKPIADSFFETLDSQDTESMKVILHHKYAANSKKVLICRKCGSVNQECEHAQLDKINLYLLETEQTLYNDEEIFDEEFEPTENSENEDIKQNGCINCHSGKSISKNVLPLRFPSNGSTSPLVSTLYSHCPEMDIKTLESETKFLQDKYGRRNSEWTPLISKGKKLLIFSDSRQDAAFFGPYLQVTHQQLIFSRFMIDIIRSIHHPINIEEWKEIANHKLRNFLYTREFAAILLKDLRPSENDLINELLNNNTSINKRIYHSIFHLIDRTASSMSGIEGIGIGAVYFDDPEFVNIIKIDGLNDNNISALAQLILRHIRLSEAFYLNPEENINLIGSAGSDTYFGFRFNKVILIHPEDNGSEEKTVRLISLTNRPNQLQEQIRYYLSRVKNIKIEEVPLEMVNEIIIKISREFIGKELVSDPKGVGYQLKINALKIMPTNIQNGELVEPINGAMSSFKACKRCGRLSWIDLNGICNYPNCFGELTHSEISLQISIDNHYRSILLGEQKFPELRAVEHTAQLNKMTAAKDYQAEFKRGRINVLSCSTTFEMGVDLGDLSTIFMRNIPPTIANYIQRAGRAGRRPGISPFVLTFCRSLPHDQYFFNNFDLIVKGEINPPVIVLENEKIAKRHYNAVILSDFLNEFKNAFNYTNKGYSKDPLLYQLFESNNEFNKSLPPNQLTLSPSEYLCNCWLSKHLELYQSKLKSIFFDNFINEKFLMQSLEDFYNYFKSDEKYGLEGNIRKRYLEAAIYYRSERDKYDPKISKQRKDFDYFETLLNQLREEHLISHLSSHGFLPSYAFPTNVVSLKILSDKSGAKLLDLNRELDRAISEYAPNSMIVANSRIYKSGAVHKFPKQVFRKIYYFHCQICNRFIRDESRTNIISKIENHILGHNIEFEPSKHQPQKAIYPEWGFAVPRDEFSEKIRSNTKLERSGYSSELFMDIEGFTGERAIIVNLNNGFVEIDLASGFNIYRVNPGKASKNSDGRMGFSLCANCGRLINSHIRKHTTPYGYPCESNEILTDYHLISIFDTDVVKIRFQNCPPLPQEVRYEKDSTYKFKSFWRSVLYAFLESISRVLDIERSDIDGLFIPSNDYKFVEIVLIDAVSGGAGHVSRLVGKGNENSQIIFNEVIHTAKTILSCKECAENTACYSCLFHHSNQKVQHTLNRSLALEWISKL